MWKNYYTHNFLSKTLYFVHNSKNGSVSVLADKYQDKGNTSLVKRFIHLASSYET